MPVMALEEVNLEFSAVLAGRNCRHGQVLDGLRVSLRRGTQQLWHPDQVVGHRVTSSSARHPKPLLREGRSLGFVSKANWGVIAQILPPAAPFLSAAWPRWPGGRSPASPAGR